MEHLEQIATRYLLGELSEPEQAAIEEKYFSAPEIFDEITKIESGLIDNYVRGRLSPQVRERFERVYLANPQRRERVKFAEALATGIDQVDGSKTAASELMKGSWWLRLQEQLSGIRSVPRLSFALPLLLLVIGGLFLFIDARRTRDELARTRTALTNQEQRERELRQRITAEQTRAEQLAAELQSLRDQAASRISKSPESSVPAFISFLISVGSTRDAAGPPNTLRIPAATKEVKLRVNLKEHNYPIYTAVLQAAGGEEIVRRQNIRPVISPDPAAVQSSFVMKTLFGSSK